jgi:hypothetical protein
MKSPIERIMDLEAVIPALQSAIAECVFQLDMQLRAIKELDSKVSTLEKHGA